MYPNQNPPPDVRPEPVGRIICNQLGYAACDRLTMQGAAVGLSVGPDATSDDFWLSQLVCAGTETRIVDCNHAGWGNENCLSDQSIAVECSGFVEEIKGYVAKTCTTNSPSANPTNSPSSHPTVPLADNLGEDENDNALKAVATLMGMLIAGLAICGGVFRFWKNRGI